MLRILWNPPSWAWVWFMWVVALALVLLGGWPSFGADKPIDPAVAAAWAFTATPDVVVPSGVIVHPAPEVRVVPFHRPSTTPATPAPFAAERHTPSQGVGRSQVVTFTPAVPVIRGGITTRQQCVGFA